MLLCVCCLWRLLMISGSIISEWGLQYFPCSKMTGCVQHKNTSIVSGSCLLKITFKAERWGKCRIHLESYSSETTLFPGPVSGHRRRSHRQILTVLTTYSGKYNLVVSRKNTNIFDLAEFSRRGGEECGGTTPAGSKGMKLVYLSLCSGPLPYWITFLTPSSECSVWQAPPEPLQTAVWTSHKGLNSSLKGTSNPDCLKIEAHGLYQYNCFQ